MTTPEEQPHLDRMTGAPRRRTGLIVGIAAGAAVLVAATVAVTLAATRSPAAKPAAQQQTQATTAAATTAAATTPAVATTAAAPAAPTTFTMGAKADTVQVSATAYAWKQPVAAKAPPPEQDGFEWGAADVEICPKIDGYVDRLSWRLTYADHTTIAPSSTGYRQFPEPEYPWDERTIAAGQCVRGWLVFPVPAGRKPATVQYQPAERTVRADWAVA